MKLEPDHNSKRRHDHWWTRECNKDEVGSGGEKRLKFEHEYIGKEELARHSANVIADEMEKPKKENSH